MMLLRFTVVTSKMLYREEIEETIWTSLSRLIELLSLFLLYVCLSVHMPLFCMKGEDLNRVSQHRAS